jgi:hypothetical protein
MTKPMNRSRNQIATAYAPGSFFTFEGGVGACMAIPIACDDAALTESTTRVIMERLEQFANAWFERAMTARDNDEKLAAKYPVLPEQCMDAGLLNEDRLAVCPPGLENIRLSKPSNMAFTPAPLTFVCRYCDLFSEFRDLRQMRKALPSLQQCACSNSNAPGGKCSWEQLDVIFVHWSGGWAQASPSQWNFRDGRAKPDHAICERCGSREFKLNRKSPRIGDWYFYCAKPTCATKKGERWMQRDEATLNILRVTVGTGMTRLPAELNMDATPYRANNAYHVHTDLFIDFQRNETKLTRLLAKDAEEELKAFIANQYGFEMGVITDADVERACIGKPDLTGILEEYRMHTASIQNLESTIRSNEALRSALTVAIESSQASKRRIVDHLREKGILASRTELPDSVSRVLERRRQLFDSRFDPFQLAVEHQLLTDARLNIGTEYVSFTDLDKDLAPSDEREGMKDRLEQVARDRLHQLGLSDMGLIRKFDLCRFSFGYSRVSSEPVLKEKHNMNMPVRLRMFDYVKDGDDRKRPIYVVQQANQAIYVRLQPERVMGWLESLSCVDPIALGTGQRPGAGILGGTVPMRRFLDRLPEVPHSYLYVYTLLHTYAHHLINQVSAYSGLDVGSLGEYLFPADLAFVVYRNGTTMDLGNLSAMWRNSGEALLDSLLDVRSLQCGTGSLCTSRGSACPDCQMIPEVACVASNKLLSRSVLRSIGGRPLFDKRQGGITGYLDWQGPIAIRA